MGKPVVTSNEFQNECKKHNRIVIRIYMKQFDGYLLARPFHRHTNDIRNVSVYFDVKIFESFT